MWYPIHKTSTCNHLKHRNLKDMFDKYKNTVISAWKISEKDISYEVHVILLMWYC